MQEMVETWLLQAALVLTTLWLIISAGAMIWVGLDWLLSKVDGRSVKDRPWWDKSNGA